MMDIQQGEQITIQGDFQEGLEEGIQLGFQEGIRIGHWEALLTVLRTRFGILPSALLLRLSSFSVEQLDSLLSLATTVPDVESFQKRVDEMEAESQSA